MKHIKIIALILLLIGCGATYYSKKNKELTCNRVVNQIDKHNYEVTLIFVRESSFKSLGRIREIIPNCLHPNLQEISKEFACVYEDGELTITWTCLPEEDVFYIKYYLYNNNCKKRKTFITGAVQYINFDTNERGHCNPAPSKLYLQ